MSTRVLTDNQREALQEIANIGMGQAGQSIAAVFDEFIELSVPRVREAAIDDLAQAVASLIPDQRVSAVRQAFLGKFCGEAIVAYDASGCRDLAELMGYVGRLQSAEEAELLLDVSNVIVSACLGGVARLLNSKVSFSAPSILARNVPPCELIEIRDGAIASLALIVEVNFKLERHCFSCSLLVLMPDAQIDVLVAALDAFLETI